MALRPQNNGFSLIELSIVLVIIGLLAGGVLVGRDLIKASEVRATLSQIERFKTAHYAFKDKFQCIPGDCAEASALGLGGVKGNGNGVIDVCIDCNSGSDSPEPDYYWQHLNDSSLISEELITYFSIKAPRSKAANSITLLYYRQPLGGGTANAGGAAFYSISLNIFSACNNPLVYQCPSLDPEFLYQMDAKIDDGLPKTGQVTGNGGWRTYFEGGVASEGAANGDFCINADVTPNAYNVTNNKKLCVSFIRFM